MTFDRRRVLKVLGLGALGAHRLAHAAPTEIPRRIVFFVQPHGHVPSSWAMPVEAPVTEFGERSLVNASLDELSPVLKPLYPFRSKVLAIAGLAHVSVLENQQYVYRTGGDSNNHNIAVAGLLTASRATQHPGFPCTGGSLSIDQLLAQRTSAEGRLASRVYGGDYVPNQTVAPFSFLGPSQATPVVKNPADAFFDLIGTRPLDLRQTKLARLRGSMLDSVAEEYRFVSKQLGRDGRTTLESHRALVRDLERSLDAQAAQLCQPTFNATGVPTRQFMRLIRLAFACDLTRVITYAAPVPTCPEFGYPANANVHASYAHSSVNGATSCGQMYNPASERAMTDLSVWYASHVAALLQELDSVPEGDGTMLDHTVVVWQTELGTPTHQHHDAFTVLAGGCHGFFKTGRYVRYPATSGHPLGGTQRLGPAHTRLYVSLLNAMGQPDTSFGTTEATSESGEPIPMTGPLDGLRG